MGKNMTPTMRGPKMAATGPSMAPKMPKMGPQMGLPAAHASMNGAVDHAPGGQKTAPAVPMMGPGGTAPGG